jgi:hypothetical protein
MRKIGKNCKAYLIAKLGWPHCKNVIHIGVAAIAYF